MEWCAKDESESFELSRQVICKGQTLEPVESISRIAVGDVLPHWDVRSPIFGKSEWAECYPPAASRILMLGIENQKALFYELGIQFVARCNNAL